MVFALQFNFLKLKMKFHTYRGNSRMQGSVTPFLELLPWIYLMTMCIHVSSKLLILFAFL